MAFDLARLFSLQGEVAIVTGGAQGMGAAIVRVLAGMGAEIALIDIQLAKAQAVAADVVAQGGKAQAYDVDMADEAAVVAMVGDVRRISGRIDMLVNNAGSQDRNYLEDTTAAYWDEIQGVNLRGPFIAIREVVKVMRADGTRGRIVNIASNSALHPSAPSLLAYSTSKAGLAGLTRAAAIEVVKDGIRVNTVLPGNTTTEGQGMTAGEHMLIPRVEGVREAYAKRLTEQQEGLAAICAAAGFGFSVHRTDHPPEAALLSLYTALAPAMGVR